MTKEQLEQRNKLIDGIANSLRKSPFTFEFEIKEKPAGIKIVWEVSQEEMDAIVAAQNNKAMTKEFKSMEKAKDEFFAYVDGLFEKRHTTLTK